MPKQTITIRPNTPDNWVKNMIDMPVSIYFQHENNDLIKNTKLSLIDMVETEYKGSRASSEQNYWHGFRIILKN